MAAEYVGLMHSCHIVLNHVMSTLRLALLLLLLPISAIAQFSNTVTRERADRTSSPYGRDHWFTLVENYQYSSSGKYFDLYVTALKATTVYIQVNGAARIARPVEAGKVVTFRIPLAWELTKSGVIEPKGVHVWSDDADLSVYVLSRNPSTSDGMYVPPTIGWGKEYLVASFNSHPGGSTGADGDLPSEFAIVAAEDSTLVTILPTTAIRNAENADQQLHAAGVPFTIRLQRGEAVMYQAMRNSGQSLGYDFTGTRVTSSKPIGVVAGHMCANVPTEFPWCDHLSEMLNPTRVWGQTYYTVPFTGRRGGDGFLVVASADNQTIYRTSQAGTRLHGSLNKHEYFFRHDIDEASFWVSDKPFMLVQYCNSTSWPGYPVEITNDGAGDPSYSVIAPLEQYPNKVVFQTPSIVAGGGAFQNHVNVIVKSTAASSALWDGRALTSAGGINLPIDGKWTAYRMSNVSPGAHVVESDSGVWAYAYGYGSYDSYAWPGPLGVNSFRSADTSAPMLTFTSDCAELNAQVVDPLSSEGIASITSDTLLNAELVASSSDNSGYSLKIVDPGEAAFARIIVRDYAGNRALAEHRYEPVAVTAPDLVAIAPPRWMDTVFTVVIRNTGIGSLQGIRSTLRYGDRGFRIIDAATSVLASGAADTTTIGYRGAGNNFDSLLVTDQCLTQPVALVARPLPIELSYDTLLVFDSIPTNTRVERLLTLRNLSRDTITITGLSDNLLMLEVDQSELPIILAPGASAQVKVWFDSPVSGAYEARITIFVESSIQFTVRVVALVLEGMGVEDREISRQGLRISPNPANGGTAVRVFLENELLGDGVLKVRDLRGVTVLTPVVWKAGLVSLTLNLEALPSGWYEFALEETNRVLKGHLRVVK